MSVEFVARLSDSPYIELVTEGRMVSNGTTVRPSEVNWHMVFTKVNGNVFPLVVGPLTTSGVVQFAEGIEVLWIKFKLGTFMPHMPQKDALDSEIILPKGAGQSFWLKSSTWQFPSYDNVETFINRLVREEILVRDPVVNAALEDELVETPSRTIRHRFMRATGLTQKHIQQFRRAQQASDMLKQGVPILDIVYDLQYYDQPHLTRSLKRFIGKTPAQELVRLCDPD